MAAEDDDLDMDLWMEMTDAEREAILAHEMRQYNEWWDRLTPLQRYRHSRGRALEGCLIWRKSSRQFGDGLTDFFHEQLRSRQRRLLKLRIQRSTGFYPGSA
jgi:hypothetical protein